MSSNTILLIFLPVLFIGLPTLLAWAHGQERRNKELFFAQLRNMGFKPLDTATARKFKTLYLQILSCPQFSDYERNRAITSCPAEALPFSYNFETILVKKLPNIEIFYSYWKAPRFFEQRYDIFLTKYSQPFYIRKSHTHEGMLSTLQEMRPQPLPDLIIKVPENENISPFPSAIVDAMNVLKSYRFEFWSNGRILRMADYGHKPLLKTEEMFISSVLEAANTACKT